MLSREIQCIFQPRVSVPPFLDVRSRINFLNICRGVVSLNRPNHALLCFPLSDHVICCINMMIGRQLQWNDFTHFDVQSSLSNRRSCDLKVENKATRD